MRTARNIWMNGHGKYELIILTVEVIEMVLRNQFHLSTQQIGRLETNLPDILDIPRIHPAVTIWCLFDKHHGRQIVNVPVSRDLHQPSFISPLQRFHPRLRLLVIVDFRPLISRSEPIHLAVMVQHGMIIFDSVIEQQLRHLLGRFPPGCNSATRWFSAKVS